ncbi:E3 ubiquitin- ligase MARCH9 [Pelobates cultripes]|uniref:E3 ubiquitin- ligase MARCH9 n=1 Tax=Pelobates cultripes TaxID=61616 RepID=A0AAD1R6L9_PELCU|nr:E3 ubiquitin- ligase MARCH9 [Pelobates cultripes]
MMFKYRLRMFFNELKVLVLTRSGRSEPERGQAMRGLGVGGCGWPPFADCSSRDDEEEYYGADPRTRNLGLEEKDGRIGAALDAVSLGSSIDSGMRTPQCRICFQGPEQWQAISLTVIEKVQIAAIILGSLFLIASISWLIWSSLSPSAKWQRQDLLFQICYGMYGFMDIVCIGLIIHEGSSVYRIFKRWQAVNQQWKVLNYDKTKDLGEPLSGTTKLGARNSRTNHSSHNDRGPGRSQRVRTILNHHCGYTILHILSHLRPNEHRNSSNSNREVVMRVTTV